MWDVLLPLLQAALVAFAGALATRIVRLARRARRVRQSVDTIVCAVEAEIEGLVHHGEAEYSHKVRTKRRLAIARVRDEWPHLTEQAAGSLVDESAWRLGGWTNGHAHDLGA